ncbi:hypothetical protein NHG29_01395 [Aerococcaceae bacterium NML160702]|nr:hypothetical protein [Aerococcaceae bacterium NML190073]MCW6681521.1 hypothetical protein [Aerococcaceae bacterium NML160702]
MRIYHCRTQEDYDCLMQQLDKEGYMWSPVENATELNIWLHYKESTCVRLMGGYLFADTVEYYKRAFPFVEIEEVRGKKNDCLGTVR